MVVFADDVSVEVPAPALGVGHSLVMLGRNTCIAVLAPIMEGNSQASRFRTIFMGGDVLAAGRFGWFHRSKSLGECQILCVSGIFKILPYCLHKHSGHPVP